MNLANIASKVLNIFPRDFLKTLMPYAICPPSYPVTHSNPPNKFSSCQVFFSKCLSSLLCKYICSWGAFLGCTCTGMSSPVLHFLTWVDRKTLPLWWISDLPADGSRIPKESDLEETCLPARETDPRRHLFSTWHCIWFQIWGLKHLLQRLDHSFETWDINEKTNMQVT